MVVQRMSDCPLLHEDSCLRSEYDCTCETCPLHEQKKVKRRNVVLSVKDKVEQFKRDCKSNEFYTKAIMDCNERIEEIDLQLTGMTSANSDDPKRENASDPYKEKKLGLIVLQDQIIKERDGYIKKINGVNSKLMRIIDPVDRQMIIEIYIQKEKCKEVAYKFHFNDHSAMFKRINAVIKKIV